MSCFRMVVFMGDDTSLEYTSPIPDMARNDKLQTILVITESW